MLVLTRRVHEALIVNERVTFVPTSLSETEATVRVFACEPIGVCRGSDLAATERERPVRTSYELLLKLDESIIIDGEFTIIFFVARIGEGGIESKARFGFESPNRTKLQSKNAAGSIVKEYEIGSERSG